MRVAVISDLHIGPRRGRDAFGHDEQAFDRWLDELLDTHDHLVLNGDIFQTDHELTVGAAVQRRALHAAMARVPWLTARLADPRVHYLHGNHDTAAQAELQTDHELRLEHRGNTVLITHGDRYDPVIGRAPGVSHAATWAAGRVRAARLQGLATWLEGRDIAIKAERFQGQRGALRRGSGRAHAVPRRTGRGLRPHPRPVSTRGARRSVGQPRLVLTGTAGVGERGPGGGHRRGGQRVATTRIH